MALPLLLIFNAGRIVSIVVRAGTALARFVAKNPRVIGSTLSIGAISSAIQSYVVTEKEKIDVVDEIGKDNPQLRADIFKNVFYPDSCRDRHSPCTLCRKKPQNNRHHPVARSNICCNSIIYYH